MHSPKAEMGKELNKHLQVNKQVIRQNPFVGDASRQVISSGTAQCHHTAPNVGKKTTFQLNVPKRTSVLQSSTGQPQLPMDAQFSNPNDKCLNCSGDHRSAVCPTWSQHQPTRSTSSYVSSTGKPHNNMSPQQSTKNSQATACSTMPTLLINNPAQAPRHGTGNNIPQVTSQVNPNVPQQHNHYMPNVIPPAQMPNQFLPPPYFPIPFLLPPVAPSNVSAASSAPASELSAMITLMTNAVNQGHSNTTAIMDALQRTTTQFVEALQQTIQMGV